MDRKQPRPNIQERRRRCLPHRYGQLQRCNGLQLLQASFFLSFCPIHAGASTGTIIVENIANLTLHRIISRSQDSPQFLLGHGVELGFVVLALLADVVLIIVYKRINKRRELACQQELAYTNQELSDKGDRALTFRYQL